MFGPARELVEVVADARDLATALVLDGHGRCGPGLGPRHRLPQQPGERQACRRRLSLPGGALGRRHAEVDLHGAAVSHERTGAGVRGDGVPRPSAATAAARKAGGSKGGAASPRQSPVMDTLGMLAYPQVASWLWACGGHFGSSAEDPKGDASAATSVRSLSTDKRQMKLRPALSPASRARSRAVVVTSAASTEARTLPQIRRRALAAYSRDKLLTKCRSDVLYGESRSLASGL